MSRPTVGPSYAFLGDVEPQCGTLKKERRAPRERRRKKKTNLPSLFHPFADLGPICVGRVFFLQWLFFGILARLSRAPNAICCPAALSNFDSAPRLAFGAHCPIAATFCFCFVYFERAARPLLSIPAFFFGNARCSLPTMKKKKQAWLLSSFLRAEDASRAPL